MAKRTVKTKGSFVQRSSYQKVCFLLCILLFLLLDSTFGAIVLQYATLDEGIQLTAMSDSVVLHRDRIPVCTLRLSVKKPGFGAIRLNHTPLFDGVRFIAYRLVFEDGTPAFYQSSTLLLEEVELPRIWAELYNPLSSEEFRSTITIHLTVER